MSQPGIVETREHGSEQQGQQGQGAGRAKLVQRLTNPAPSLPEFVTDLISAQAVTVAGTEAAGFVIERMVSQIDGKPDFTLRPIAHVRPGESTPEIRAAAIQAFQELVRPCVDQGKDGAIEIDRSGDPSNEPQFCLITVLRNEGEIVAASAVVTRAMNLERARQRLMSMQLVAGYFELYTLRRGADQARLIAQSHQHVLQLTTAVATAEGFEPAARNLCNELANRSGAARVALGWLKGKNIRVRALSNTEQFDKKQELIVDIERVMEECADQQEPVHYDPTGKGSDNVTRNAQNLSQRHGGHIVLALPLRRKDEIESVITLEFPPSAPLGPQVASGLTVAVDLLAPQLHDRFQNDRYLITKAGISTRELLRAAVGPKYWVTKIVSVLALAAVLVVTNAPYALLNAVGLSAVAPYVDCRMTYKVKAPFEFVATEKRLVNAPFEGYIESVFLEPGQDVAAGDPLFKMRTRDMEIERLKAEKQVAEFRQKEAAARRENRSGYEVNAYKYQAEQAQAQADLLAYKIDQATVRAPVGGKVLQGLLKEREGSPVQPKDVLYEVGDPTDVRVALSVNERDIQRVGAGSKAWIATNALPSDEYPVTVERVVPQGNPREATNVFTVYADADQRADAWRPGMKGEARIEWEQRSIGYIWTHRVWDWVRLYFWI